MVVLKPDADNTGSNAVDSNVVVRESASLGCGLMAENPIGEAIDKRIHEARRSRCG